MLPARGCVPDLTLVRVEPRHADSVAHARVEVIGQSGEARLTFRFGADVRNLLSLKQSFEPEDVDTHPADASLAVPGCPSQG